MAVLSVRRAIGGSKHGRLRKEGAGCARCLH
jgi:hypothetical protein